MGSGASRDRYRQQVGVTVSNQHSRREETRLNLAVEAIASFFIYNFKDNDGFALATFSTHYTSAESRNAVGNGGIEAEQPILDLGRVQPSGATRLYSSIKDAVVEFEQVRCPAIFPTQCRDIVRLLSSLCCLCTCFAT